MAKASFSLPVEPSEDLSDRVRRAFAQRGWEVVDRGQEVVAREDATRLCCIQSPAEVSLRFETGATASTVRIEARVPGFGPVASRSARTRLEFAARTVLAARA